MIALVSPPVAGRYIPPDAEFPILSLVEHMGDRLILQGRYEIGPERFLLNSFLAFALNTPLDIPDLPASVRDFYSEAELAALDASEVPFTIRMQVILEPGDYSGNAVVEQADLDRWRARFEADPEAQVPRREDPHLVEVIRSIPPHHHGEAESPQFSAGAQVRVRRMHPEGHHRCPRYVRGVVGEVERLLGADPAPEDEEVEPCYTVRFSSVDLFGDQTEAGEAPYTLLIDLWERYLEPAP